MKNQTGAALVLVLWLITLLIIMASSFALTLQREITVVTGIKQNAEASAINDAGIHYAILMLLHPDPLFTWKTYNSIYEVEYAGKRIRIQIADESGKISINSAKEEQIQQLFKSIGLAEEPQNRLTDAILDWRDENDLHRLFGAEKDQYEEADLQYQPRNKPFQTKEELQMVLGMNSEIYNKIEPMISIYSKGTSIDPKTASKTVLLSLPEVTETEVEEYIQLRIEQQRNQLPVENPTWFTGNANSSQVYSILAEVEIEKDLSKQTLAIVRKGKGINNLGFEVLKWDNQHRQDSLFLPQQDELIVNKS